MIARDSTSSLPFILVALLSFGALTPHLVSRPAPAGSAADAVAGSNAPPPSGRVAGNTAATDLLGEYFQIDTTPDGLKKRVAVAARALNDRAEQANALVVRAFVCGQSPSGADSRLRRARRISAALVGSVPSAALSNCEQALANRPATGADIAWLATYVQGLLDSKQDSAAFERGPVTRAVIREQARGVDIEFLIATVPDPVDSFQSWQFDPALDGLRRGIEGNGYTFQRFQFPDIAVEQKPQTSLTAQRDLHRQWPGVVLFSRPASVGNREDLLVLFLVPETPTAGIHHEAFQRSVEFVADWSAEGGDASKVSLAAIIGPTFSGSTRSLTRALQAAASNLKRLPCGTLRVISGNATNYDNKSIVDDALKHSQLCLSILFKATVHPNQAMNEALRRFQETIGVTGNLATITENTVFGRDQAGRQQLAKTTEQDRSGDLQITVPLNIAQLRNGGVAARRAGTLDPVLPSVRPLPLQDLVHATDQLVVRTPETTAAYTELVLRNLIATIRRENIRAVQVTMTDVRDRLLLTKELRQRAPDVMIFTLDADLLYSHPDQYPWTTDVVVVSSYPLHPVAQLRTTASDLRHRPRRPQQFQNFSSQGIYNATVAALNYDVKGRPKDPERARLVDYAPHQGQPCPAIWISVVGRESLWPVSWEPGCNNETREYMVPATGEALLQSGVESAPSQGTVRVLIAMVLALCVAGFVGRRHLWHRYAPEAFAFAILALLGVAAWFGQGLTPVLLAVVVLTVIPVAAALPGRYSESRLGWVPLAAAAAAGMPLLVYVVLAGRQPFVTSTRLLEIENGISPLAPILMMAAVPLLISAVVLRHRYLRGGAGLQPPVTAEAWKQSTIDVLDRFALGRLQDLSPKLTAIYKDVFYLPSALWLVVGASLVVVAAIAFDFHWPFVPVWSVNGRSFGVAVFAVVLTLQCLLTVSLLQFLLQWRACAELLRRLARHSLGPAYKYVPRKMIPEGVLPKRLRLDDLKALLDRMPASEKDAASEGLQILNDELKAHNESAAHLRIKPRWFSSGAWTGPVRRVLLSAQMPPSRPWTSEQKDVCGFVAMACVMVVRELMARLTVSLLFIGPCLALLVGIHATAPFQGSHAFLAIIWFDVLATIGVVMSAFVQMDRDETLSLVTDTDPGHIAWNVDLLSKVAVYVVLPLLILFASQFPGIGTSIADVFRSIPRVGP